MLRDIPSVLEHEMKAQIEHVDGAYLESLRASNPWNFHFGEPHHEQVDGAQSLLEAAAALFTRFVYEQNCAPDERLMGEELRSPDLNFL